jgi:SAM-dependent methyltransferase
MTGPAPRPGHGAGRLAILPALGIHPSTREVVRLLLDEAMTDASLRSVAEGRRTTVLDAGCGRVSALRPFRPRIGELVGLDIRPQPAGSVAHLDRLVVADMCVDADTFDPGTFDVVLLSFTIEHLADPAQALVNLLSWTRPGGTLIATTVNRRHPFVGLYLDLPHDARDRLQGLVKARPDDAHGLIGACTTRRGLAGALRDAGWTDVRISTVGHLARAWSRTWPTFALGVAGDLATRRMPARRSTIVAAARRPAATTSPASSGPVDRSSSSSSGRSS